MSILMLAASKNTVILVTVEGEDAESTLKGLIEAFANAFGEEVHGNFSMYTGT